MSKGARVTREDADKMIARLAKHTPQPNQVVGNPEFKKAGFIEGLDPDPMRFDGVQIGIGRGPDVKIKSGPKRKAKGMNVTEGRYADILESQKKLGQIKDYDFEGMKLKVGEGSYYCPDFTVTLDGGHIRFVEVKGKHIWDDAKQKFKAAKLRYRQFDFQMWQWDSKEHKFIHLY